MLDSIRSPTPQVLDYYELEGERTRERGWWVLTPDRPARFNTMALAATAAAAARLWPADAALPLYGQRRAPAAGVEGT